jgi:O-antigen ligase
MLQRAAANCDAARASGYHFSLPSETSRAQRILGEIAFWTGCGSAVAILFSIAVSQSLMGIAIACLLLSRTRIRLPRAWIPLALFLLGTMISLLASGDPRAGMPQVRKLYVYLALAMIFTIVRTVGTARNLMIAWCAAAGIGSVIGIVQFVHKWRQAEEFHLSFYRYYLNARITGTMSHWMTFSGEQMLVLIILAAFLLFGRLQRKAAIAGWVIAACAMAAALLLSDTRSVWIATLAALVYLTWNYRKAFVLAVPVLAVLVYFIAPHTIQERVTSIVEPHGTVDSNTFRVVVWRTGLRMIAAHPWLGLGPEIVHRDFYAWLPPDIPRPLPDGYYGHLHSIYIHYAAERGIPTTLALLWMLGMILFDCGRALGRIPKGRGDERFVLNAAIACVIAILIEGFFELNLGDSEVLTMFLVLTACAYVAVDSSRSGAAVESVAA